jgi:hypothetical protein
MSSTRTEDTGGDDHGVLVEKRKPEFKGAVSGRQPSLTAFGRKAPRQKL